MTTARPTGTGSKSTVHDVCALLGVPPADWNTFARWGVELHSARSHAAREDARDSLHAYVDVMIAQRCLGTTDDLLSALISAEIDGHGFTTDELQLSVTTLVTMASMYQNSCPRR